VPTANAAATAAYKKFVPSPLSGSARRTSARLRERAAVQPLEGTCDQQIAERTGAPFDRAHQQTARCRAFCGACDRAIETASRKAHLTDKERADGHEDEAVDERARIQRSFGGCAEPLDCPTESAELTPQSADPV
jgi:hypothetical protein